jgi:hypothetical protein
MTSSPLPLVVSMAATEKFQPKSSDSFQPKPRSLMQTQVSSLSQAALVEKQTQVSSLS